MQAEKKLAERKRKKAVKQETQRLALKEEKSKKQEARELAKEQKRIPRSSEDRIFSSLENFKAVSVNLALSSRVRSVVDLGRLFLTSGYLGDTDKLSFAIKEKPRIFLKPVGK